ncbi:hypothetical protein BH23ACI1_BH23ACI1_29400 [soil metagenome]
MDKTRRALLQMGAVAPAAAFVGGWPSFSQQPSRSPEAVMEHLNHEMVQLFNEVTRLGGLKGEHMRTLASHLRTGLAHSKGKTWAAQFNREMRRNAEALNQQVEDCDERVLRQGLAGLGVQLDPNRPLISLAADAREHRIKAFKQRFSFDHLLLKQAQELERISRVVDRRGPVMMASMQDPVDTVYLCMSNAESGICDGANVTFPTVCDTYFMMYAMMLAASLMFMISNGPPELVWFFALDALLIQVMGWLMAGCFV